MSALIPSIGSLDSIPNTIKTTESIQSTVGLYFALINVANTLYLVPVPTASQLHFAFTPEGA